MTRFRPQLHYRAVHKVLQPVVCKKSLSLRDLNFVCAALPNVFVVGCDSILQRRRPCLYRLERLNKAVRRVECVVGTLAAI
jgi:hypothetical protein